TPLQAGPGTTLTIQGQGFSTTPSANTVRINGIVATVLSATANTLVVTVPSGATSGTISITVGTTTANSGTAFTVLPLAQITSITPKFLVRGAAVPTLTV